MSRSVFCQIAPPVMALLLALTMPLVVNAAERGRTKVLKHGEFNPANDSVEMFAAIKDGKIKVRLIAKDSTEANIFIENVSKKPLNVQLPEAFGAVPVLAQFGGAGGAAGGAAGGGAMGSGQAQPMGGGMGGMGGGGMGGMGGGGMGGGGGFFNVPPEKKASFKVTCVCLEHGRTEPRPAINYEIRPLDTVTTKPGVFELLTLLGYGMLDQRGAQVAAWNLNNNMSFDELASKQIERLDGDSYPYFSQDEMRSGISAVAASMNFAEQRAKNPRPVKTPSTDGPSSTKDTLSVPAAIKKD